MEQQDGVGAAANPDPWPRADATGAGLEDMIRDERSRVNEALSPTRRGDDPAGPPADERILRTLRKVGGDSVVVPIFKLPLDRPR